MLITFEKAGIKLTPISIAELLQITNGKLLFGKEDGQVKGVSVDTRTLSHDDLYVAFEGARVDGHQFVEKAVQAGASAILVTKPVLPKKNTIPVILVADALVAIQAMASRERQVFFGPVIGVTGSNGKTTTKEILGAVFQTLGSCLYTKANQNNELGLPLTILQRNASHCSIVLEMGMRGYGQIQSLCKIASPTAGIITNIGQSHLELLGSQEGIANAKAELLDALPKDGICALPIEDKWARKVSNRFQGTPLWYGFDTSADAYASEIESVGNGMEFVARVLGQTGKVFIPSFGRHNVQNALGALLIGAAYGLSIEEMSIHLSRMKETPGRLHIVHGRNGRTIIDDCYNASPLSVKASIDVLTDIAGGSKTAIILGDMYELGNYTESGHREVGAYAAAKQIDTIVAIGAYGQWIAKEAGLSGAKNVHFLDSVASAMPTLETILPSGSMVLVKASRGMHFEQIVDYLVEAEATSSETQAT
jgi:UDP-N-acetylmuramoyl-tripeptide--D-alanyl-D-alanine ligase